MNESHRRLRLALVKTGGLVFSLDSAAIRDTGRDHPSRQAGRDVAGISAYPLYRGCPRVGDRLILT